MYFFYCAPSKNYGLWIIIYEQNKKRIGTGRHPRKSSTLVRVKMNLHVFYFFPLVFSSAISAGLVIFLWRARTATGAKALIGMMTAVSVWSLAYAFDYAGLDIATKLWWVRIEYIGIVTAPPLWLIFALAYTGEGRRISPALPVFLAFVSLTFWGMIWTNGQHHLVWRDAWLEGDPPLLSYDRGEAFWLLVIYSYSLLFAGTLLMLRTLIASHHLIRRQMITLIVGTGAPWLGNIVYLLDLELLRGLDPTPFVFTISGLAFSLGFFRFKLLDLAPIAREAVINGLTIRS